MSSRPHRDTVLNNTDSLILAQAVWEHGADKWPTIARIVSRHPLVTRPKLFTTQSTRTIYESLMKEAGLEWTEECNITRSPINYRLAENFYRARFAELRELILAEEAKFKAILLEIESIRSGKYDTDIKAKMTGAQASLTTEPSSVEQPEPSSIIDPPVLIEPPPTNYQGPPTEPSSQKSFEEAVEESESMNVDPADLSHHTPPGHTHTGQQVVEDETAIIQELLHADVPESSSTFILETAKDQPAVDDHENHQEEEEEEEETKVVDGVTAAIDNAIHQQEEEEEEEEGEEGEEEEEEEEITPEDQGREGSHAVSEQPTQRETPPSPVQQPSLSEVGQIIIEDSDSSGEEPLHVSRRSTRQRKPMALSVQPVQTRGKTRRQHADSTPVETKLEEPDVVRIDETDDATSAHDIDQDESTDGVLRHREGKRKALSAEGVGSPHEKKRARDDSEPIDEDESGPSSQVRGRRQGIRSEGQVALKRFQNVIGMLHSQISQHRNGNIFHNPIKDSEAPDYHDIVKRPIDLKTIKMKVKDGSILNSSEYQRDIYLMFANAMMYNRPGSDVYSMAEDMMIESEGHILAFRQTEGLVRGVHR